MTKNLLVISCCGIAIAVIGFVLVWLPQPAKQFIAQRSECFLTIPPIAVASYILVFTYMEKFPGGNIGFGSILLKICEGTVIAGGLFFLLSVVIALLYKIARSRIF